MERWEVVAFLNSFLHLMLIGCILTLIIHLFQKRWRFAAIGLIPLVYFAVSYGALFSPERILDGAVTSDLRVLTYNIHSEIKHLNPMIALIRETDADIVALQEVSESAALRFDDEFGDEYPYRAFHTIPGEPIPGQGVMSRYPITADYYWRNDFLPLYLGHQRVEINIEGSPLVLYNVHPIHPLVKTGQLFNGWLRAAEIDSVLERAAGESERVLIVGDFNMTDQSEDYQRLTARYGDAYREVGWGLGFSFPDFGAWYAVPIGRALPVHPMVRLDYQFYTDGLRPVEAQVWGASGGSDHRPVLVDYVLESG
jgi:vancomycin resistance protein VanJ